jgi:hypothetical protein
MHRTNGSTTFPSLRGDLQYRDLIAARVHNEQVRIQAAPPAANGACGVSEVCLACELR